MATGFGIRPDALNAQTVRCESPISSATRSTPTKRGGAHSPLSAGMIAPFLRLGWTWFLSQPPGRLKLAEPQKLLELSNLLPLALDGGPQGGRVRQCWNSDAHIP
jgi:hypothetical protein